MTYSRLKVYQDSRLVLPSLGCTIAFAHIPATSGAQSRAENEHEYGDSAANHQWSRVGEV